MQITWRIQEVQQKSGRGFNQKERKEQDKFSFVITSKVTELNVPRWGKVFVVWDNLTAFRFSKGWHKVSAILIHRQAGCFR